ncbi:hypothetical protein EYZ11_013285 [Aspergillus tanneri]|uniref:Nephrocystin 3-like N-terminal domain-containing protein n=1 Tax=Aspergillus tanneri TaxID=1220188 RepID=A0A4S3J093_9EURO|nr:hypothetical protein EYZ11_013285 [Aspergillus tanneri]
MSMIERGSRMRSRKRLRASKTVESKGPVMRTKPQNTPQKPSGEEQILWVGLNEFYEASKHKCDGITATAQEVFMAAEKAGKKLKSSTNQFTFDIKTKPCLLSMQLLASALDETVMSPSAKPSALIWGCIQNLFKLIQAARRLIVHLEKVAEMFSDIGDFADESRLRDSTGLLTSITVRRKIPALYSSVLMCCARAMEKIARKRETIRSIVSERIIQPFAFTCAEALEELQERRQAFLCAVQEAKRATMQISRLSSLPVLEVDREIVTEALLNRLQESQNVRYREKKAQGQDLSPFTQWLQPPEYEEALQRSSKPCYADTISRIKKEWAYIQWAQPTRSARCLWIHGDAGTGKTPLAAAMIKDNKARIDSINPPSENQYGLCFVFISPSNPAGQSIAGMLKYLVAQLEQYTCGNRPIRKVLDLSLGGNPQQHELHRSCLSCIKRLARVIIVVDGLDHAADPRGLAAALLALYDNVYPLVKLLVLRAWIVMLFLLAPVTECNLVQDSCYEMFEAIFSLNTR